MLGRRREERDFRDVLPHSLVQRPACAVDLEKKLGSYAANLSCACWLETSAAWRSCASANSSRVISLMRASNLFWAGSGNARV